MTQVRKKLLTQFSKIKLPKKSVDFMQQVTALLTQADKPNRNDRIYPYDILKRQNDKFLKMIKQGRGRGQLDHPQTFQVNLSNVSHMFTDLWWQGKFVYGKFIILPTPKGQIFKTLLNNGVKIGFSSRGAGSTTQGYGQQPDIVQDDYDLVTYDAVSWPSSYNAWVIYQSNGNKKLVHTRNQSVVSKKPMLYVDVKQNQEYLQQMYKLIKG